MQRRKHKRVRAQGVAGHLRTGADFLPGLSVENLSLGGAYVRTAQPMAPGTAVVLELVRPGLKKVIRVTGRVVTIVTGEEARATRRVPGMGVAFDPLDVDAQGRIKELLGVLAPDQPLLESDAHATFAPPETLRAVGAVEPGRVTAQVRGVMNELGGQEQRLKQLERENEQLRRENAQLKSQLNRK